MSKINIYKVDVQLNPNDGIIDPAIMLESKTDGYLFVIRGLFVTSTFNLDEVKIKNKEFIISLNL